MHRSVATRLGWTAAGLAVLLAFAVGSGAARSNGGDPEESLSVAPAPLDKHPTLSTDLARVARVQRERGTAAALAAAAAGSTEVSEGSVRVEIETTTERNGALRAAITAAGGVVESRYETVVEALVPPSMLEPLAAQASVRSIGRPTRQEQAAFAGEGVQTSGANVWHSAGLRGAGVKIGIIDGGFKGHQQRQAEGDLPASISTNRSLCSDAQFDGPSASDHGTSVAEIVHEMAPDAQLHLICSRGLTSLGQAKDYAVVQGIHLVNYSAGFYVASRGDGSGGPGTPDGIVDDARARGILWVAAAGNEALQHWSGRFSDTDGDRIHNYTASDEGNSFSIPDSTEVCAYLKWDDWPTSSQDFDLALARSSDGVTVARGNVAQTGTQRPREIACYENRSGISDNFFAAVINRTGPGSAPLDLYVSEVRELEYRTAAGSLIEPASSPNAMAVGAVCWQSTVIEPFSSQGPTIDHRVKPDIAGLDSVSSATDGTFSRCGGSGFVGTSAATPHVVGAAALVKQANMSFTPAQLQAALEATAFDLGAPGKDSEWGAGKLTLGAAPGTPPPPPPAPPPPPPPAPPPPPPPAPPPPPPPAPPPPPPPAPPPPPPPAAPPPPPPAAPPPPPPAAPQTPRARCVVPSVVGRTLAAATQALFLRNCTVGRVTKIVSKTVRTGRVVSQSPKAGARLADGVKVNLRISRGLARR